MLSPFGKHNLMFLSMKCLISRHRRGTLLYNWDSSVSYIVIRKSSSDKPARTTLILTRKNIRFMSSIIEIIRQEKPVAIDEKSVVRDLLKNGRMT
jgi:hypothetical protein